jgi:membrane protein
MFGLWVFWIFVLIGGQISYAVQNVHVRNSRLAWGSLSAANRERLSLGVLLAICRRFHAALPPISGSELAAAVRLPTQVLNECLNRIIAAGFVMAVPPPDSSKSTDTHYQPTRPLNRISLYEFKLSAERLGAPIPPGSLGTDDPAVDEFEAAIERMGAEGFFHRSVDEVLEQESPSK